MSARMAPPALADLNNVRFLVDVVQAGSFSAAARASQLPPSTVSRRVARLEGELGVRVFQRTTRSLKLTDAGRTYVEHAQRALAELAAGQQAVAALQETPRGRVRLTAPTGFGEVLGDLLSRFLAEYPEVRVELELAPRYVDLVAEAFDLALRATRDTSSMLVGRRVISWPRQLFASPRYLETRGTPRSLHDLERHDCVIVGARSDRATWTFDAGKATRKIVVRGRVAVNEAQMAALYAAKGLGLVYLPRSLCKPFVDGGQLRHILPRFSGRESSLWLVYPDRRLSAASRALAEFLTRELARILPAS